MARISTGVPGVLRSHRGRPRSHRRPHQPTPPRWPWVGTPSRFPSSRRARPPSGAADLHEIWASSGIARNASDDALASWREAFRLAPSDRLRERILMASASRRRGGPTRYSAAAHFSLKYDGALDQDLVARLTDFLEDQFSG